jgi:GNAT superfamily N-acetyltransferase
MSVEVRQARGDEDYARLHALLVEYEADLPPELRHYHLPDDWLFTPDGPREAVFLAVRGGDAIGCVVARQFDDETAVIMRLYVRPQARGLGIARALVNAALDFMRTCGYKRVVLDTAKEQLQAAYQLYLSLGFRDCEAWGPVDYQCPTFMELYL